MPGWLTQIDGGAAKGGFADPTREQTTAKRMVTLGIYDVHTSGSAVECQHQDIDVRGAIGVTVRARGVVGAWTSRTLVVRRVVANQELEIGAGKTLTPGAPTLELAETDLVGAEYLRIAVAGTGSTDASGYRVEVTAVLKENVTPVAVRIDSGSVASGGASVALPE
jgi:hypothetical protein